MYGFRNSLGLWFLFFLQVFLSGGQELMDEGLRIDIQTITIMAG